MFLVTFFCALYLYWLSVGKITHQMLYVICISVKGHTHSLGLKSEISWSKATVILINPNVQWVEFCFFWNVSSVLLNLELQILVLLLIYATIFAAVTLPWHAWTFLKY